MVPCALMKRKALYRVGLVVVLGVLMVSVRFEKLDDRRSQQRANQFDAEGYARDLWEKRLPAILDQAVDVQKLLPLLNTDMAAAMAQGRTLGESRVHAYLMAGRGTIVAQGKKGLALSVAEPARQPEVLLVTGAFVSGNAVRDASGLVNVSDFSDTMKFNRISFEINRIVVQEVIRPFVDEAPAVGRRVHFVAAAEVAEDATETHGFGEAIPGTPTPSHHLIKVIPIRLTLE